MNVPHVIAGWGQCGAFNTPGVYDFFWVLAGIMYAAVIIGTTLSLTSRSVKTRWVTLVMKIMAFVPLTLGLFVSGNEVSRYFSGHGAYCDPINQLQMLVLAVPAVVGFIMISINVLLILQHFRRQT